MGIDQTSSSHGQAGPRAASTSALVLSPAPKMVRLLVDEVEPDPLPRGG